MSELAAGAFLRALSRAGRNLLAQPARPQAVEDAIAALQRAAEVLTSGEPEVVIGVGEDAFFLGTRILPHCSTQFHGMRRRLQQRFIDSITVTRHASRHDLADLAVLVAGRGSDLPAGGTVRLNEQTVPPDQWADQPISGLRRTYGSSLDALRAASSGRRLELERVAAAVDGFLQGGAAEGGPSLLLATLHNHDEEAFYHSVNVCLLCLALGRAIGLDDGELRLLGVAGLLFDVGQLTPDQLAPRPAHLSNDEWSQIRLHPQDGALTILAASRPGEEIAAQVALEHHVRFDGGGYPDIGGRAPHLFSRLVSVADAYDAMTSYRSHRPARTPSESLGVILAESRRAYDPDVVQAFAQVMGFNPPGSLLRLENGELVVVTAAGGGNQAMLVGRQGGALLETPQPVDLQGRRVAAHLVAEDAGVDPAELFEAAESGPTSSD